MTPTQTLNHEHKVILLVVDAAEREGVKVEGGGAVDTERIESMLSFFREFADACHHAKEERHLFPAMNAKGIPLEAGPIAVMLHEHDQGRAFLRALDQALARVKAGEEGAAEAVAGALLGYAGLLRAHISKEDNVLFPMADRILSPADQEALAAAFERVEAEEIDEGVHERYHELAHTLAQG
jgi:hemerythrin-like domain-containing protein